MARTKREDTDTPRIKGVLARLGRAGGLPVVPTISWGDLDPVLLQRAVRLATEANMLVTFGLTRKGDSLMLSVYENGDKQSWYPAELHVASACLEDLIDACAALISERQ